MNPLIHVLLIGLTLINTAPVFAQEGVDFAARTDAGRAVNITLSSDGRGLDNAALRAVRKLVGRAIAADTVDTFAVYSPRAGGPIPIEGGLSACAEAGFNIAPKRFDTFVSQLRSIRPNAGTFLNVELTEQCRPIDSSGLVGPLSCGGYCGMRTLACNRGLMLESAQSRLQRTVKKSVVLPLARMFHKFA